VEALWIISSGLAFSSWLPGSGWRCALLRLFGARVGRSVVIKHYVRVKFPWKLAVGDYSWLGESVWIDNLDQVTIGSHCCISQGAYFCTGSHRWDRETFDVVTKPIVIEDHCWVATMVSLMPGTRLRRGAVLTPGMQASDDFQADTVHMSKLDIQQRPRKH
jgi:putative colanic acid biosynthesis acetyltransferase WcaF